MREIIFLKKTLVTLIEDPLNVNRTASNESTLVFEMLIITYRKNTFTVLGQEKAPILLLHDDACKELAFLYLFSKENLR